MGGCLRCYLCVVVHACFAAQFPLRGAAEHRSIVAGSIYKHRAPVGPAVCYIYLYSTTLNFLTPAGTLPGIYNWPVAARTACAPSEGGAPYRCRAGDSLRALGGMLPRIGAAFSNCHRAAHLRRGAEERWFRRTQNKRRNGTNTCKRRRCNERFHGGSSLAPFLPVIYLIALFLSISRRLPNAWVNNGLRAPPHGDLDDRRRRLSRLWRKADILDAVVWVFRAAE